MKRSCLLIFPSMRLTDSEHDLIDLSHDKEEYEIAMDKQKDDLMTQFLTEHTNTRYSSNLILGIGLYIS